MLTVKGYGFTSRISEELYNSDPHYKMNCILQPEKHLGKKAIVVDIDGVMTHITPDGVLQNDLTYRKGIYSLVESLNDLPKSETVKRLMTFHRDGYEIIFLTYRTEDHRIVTDHFLRGAVCFPYTLFMLPNHMANVTPPYFKKWVVESLIMPYFHVEHFLDDDKKTCVAVGSLKGVKAHHIASN